MVDELGDQLLTGTAGSVDKHRRIRARNFSREFDCLREPWSASEDGDVVAVAVLSSCRRIEFTRFTSNEHRVRGPTQEDLELTGAERFGEIVPRPGLNPVRACSKVFRA